MYCKRGQLMIFLVLSIVLVFFLISYFLFYPSYDGFSRNDHRLSVVRQSLEDCMDQAVLGGLDDLGASGGYYEAEYESDSLGVAYYFYEKENIMPDLDVLEEEMEGYVQDSFRSCASNSFSSFESYSFYYDSLDVSLDFRRDDSVNVSVDFPFGVVIENDSYLFDEPFLGSYDVGVYSVYSFVLDVVEMHEEQPNAFCLNCILDLARDNGYFVEMWSFEEDDVTFFVKDPTSSVGGEEYMYIFSIKYPGGYYDPFEDI